MTDGGQIYIYVVPYDGVFFTLGFSGLSSRFMKTLKASPARVPAFPCLDIESMNKGEKREREYRAGHGQQQK